jgi:hypothetical protein
MPDQSTAQICKIVYFFTGPAIHDIQKKSTQKSRLTKMILKLLNLLSSARSQYSLSMDYNMSYEWHLRANEHLLVAPSARGAYVECSTYDGLAVKAGLAGSSLRPIEGTTSLIGIAFGTHTGDVLLTALKDLTFVIHIRFLPYTAGQEAEVLFAPRRSPIDESSANDSAAPPGPVVPGRIDARNWVLVVGSVALAVCIGVGIICAVRRENHGDYQEIEISDSEDFDEYIPSVSDGQRATGGRCAPYVACKIENGSIEHLSNKV